MSHPDQQPCIKIENINEQADESKEISLNPNRNMKQEPVNNLEDEIIKTEPNTTISHSGRHPYFIEIENIDKQTDQSEVTSFSSNRNVKQETVCDVEDETTNIELNAIRHPKHQHYIEIENIKSEVDQSKDNLLDQNIIVKQEPVGVQEDDVIMKELYEDHEVKEEMTIGPMMLQHSGVAQESCVQSPCVQVKKLYSY